LEQVRHFELSEATGRPESRKLEMALPWTAPTSQCELNLQLSNPFSRPANCAEDLAAKLLGLIVRAEAKFTTLQKLNRL
jgi:hypothetical protein